MISKEHTVAHLAGGDLASKDMCIMLIELLDTHQIRIVNADLVRSCFDAAASLAIDSRTGTIYSPISSHHLHKTSNEDVEFRLQMVELHQFTQFPLTQCHSRVEEVASSAPKSKSSVSSAHYATGLTTFKTVTSESGAKTPLRDTPEVDNSHCPRVIL